MEQRWKQNVQNKAKEEATKKQASQCQRSGQIWITSQRCVIMNQNGDGCAASTTNISLSSVQFVLEHRLTVQLALIQIQSTLQFFFKFCRIHTLRRTTQKKYFGNLSTGCRYCSIFCKVLSPVTISLIIISGYCPLKGYFTFRRFWAFRLM